jgi:hypothetical protein
MKLKPSLLVSAAAAGAGIWMSKKENQAKMQNMMESVKNKWNNRSKDDTHIHKTGNPHPHDVEDNTMVSEGAQTSVHYYNSTAQ